MESLAKVETLLTGKEVGMPVLVQIATIRSQQAARITWHSHQCFEILLVTDGATAYEFEDGRTVDLRGGHFLVIPPGTLHRGVHDVRRPADLSGLMVDFQQKYSIQHTPFSVRDIKWLAKQLEGAGTQPRRMSPDLLAIAKKVPMIIPKLDLTRDAVAVSVRLSVCSILLECAKLLSAQLPFEPEMTVRKAIGYMESHLSQSANVAEITKTLQCSRAKFFQAFKASTGMTPVDYWQRLRIDRAQELLVGSDKSITEIAMDCGFSTSQYFSTVFRKYAGCSPSDYRMSGDSPI